MECPSCQHAITPAMELSLPQGERDEPFLHCPYCLTVLRAADEQSADSARSISVARHSLRWKTRERFVDALLAQSEDGKLRCPVCGHLLNKGDELILRNNEHFRCHHCCHDLATRAYRQEAYREQLWLSIVAALSDLRDSDQCACCCYFGAIAKACQLAFSWLPTAPPRTTTQVASMLRRADWTHPDCDWQSCLAVRRYVESAAEALLLL